MDNEIMTAEEVANYLRLDLTTVQRMAARGELPAVKVGRHWRFKKEHLDAVFDEDARKNYVGADRESELCFLRKAIWCITQQEPKVLLFGVLLGIHEKQTEKKD